MIPIIAVICAGITALSTAGGAAAGTIIAAKNSAETERHNKQFERIAEGNSITYNELNRTIQSAESNDKEGGTLTADTLFKQDQRSFIPLLQAIYKGITTVKESGELSDLRDRSKLNSPPTLPVEKTNTISDKAMSDDELTQRSVAYLTGKGFQISFY